MFSHGAATLSTFIHHYHRKTMNPLAVNSPEQTAAYLRTLPAIRERCGRVHALAQEGKLEYFEYHPEKEADAAAFCIEIMKACAPRNTTIHNLTSLSLSSVILAPTLHRWAP